MSFKKIKFYISEDEIVWLPQSTVSAYIGVRLAIITDHVCDLIRSGKLKQKNSVSMRRNENGYLRKYYAVGTVFAVISRIETPRSVQFGEWMVNLFASDFLDKGLSPCGSSLVLFPSAVAV